MGGVIRKASNIPINQFFFAKRALSILRFPRHGLAGFHWALTQQLLIFRSSAFVELHGGTKWVSSVVRSPKRASRFFRFPETDLPVSAQQVVWDFPTSETGCFGFIESNRFPGRKSNGVVGYCGCFDFRDCGQRVLAVLSVSAAVGKRALLLISYSAQVPNGCGFFAFRLSGCRANMFPKWFSGFSGFWAIGFILYSRSSRLFGALRIEPPRNLFQKRCVRILNPIKDDQRCEGTYNP